MRKARKIILVLGIIIVLFVSGCVQTEKTESTYNGKGDILRTNVKECLADNDCFEKALLLCDRATFAVCMGSLGCEKAEILGGQDGNCRIRNWAEDGNGKVINYDKECLVPRGYKIDRSFQGEIYASRICLSR